ncbi:hypothetical protein [Haliscomenobacter hydrossis]|uniref:WD40 repeat-containing protein n=1 Tax=Haliscomenobacter hydrossis (strain ATCC 27775 / DSM 1100 / LMG 10767 / O) TaxID=760192 RepID=F4L7J8_HALH1|nr:hypothetical protein [Haliscomenobacter hydrossis]AEE54178.1 WD40 repeat-containing protein [Haliscomenobacter hydrossis DSM 1100]
MKRYPGIRPFRTEEKDQFFGRDTDIERLYRLIDLEQLVILYSKSGYGKSSLLSAGIFPRLKMEERRFWEIRFGPCKPGETPAPADAVRQAILRESRDEQILATQPSIWQAFKSIQNAGKCSFLLVFDQFEELFSYPPEQILEFKKQLAEALYSRIPKRYETVLAAIGLSPDEEDAVYQPFELKVVFSIRSDRMSLLNELKDYLPNILQHGYELEALDETTAKEAVCKPAALTLEAEHFDVPPFTYAPNTLTAIFVVLRNERNRIETSVLQIVCRYVEDNVAGTPNQTIHTSDLGDIKSIFRAFYERTIAHLPEDQQETARLLVEDKLIKEGMRIPYASQALLAEPGVTQDLLDRLASSSLLRVERDEQGRMIYEVGHDTLITPVIEARTARHKEEEKLENLRLEEIARQERLENEKKLVEAKHQAEKEKQKNEKLEEALRKAKISTSWGKALAFIDKEVTLGIRFAEVSFKLAPTIESVSAFKKMISDPQIAFYSKVFQGFDDTILALAFSPDSTKILTGSGNAIATLWDIKTGKCEQLFIQHTASIWAAIFSPDGKKILTGGADQIAILWDIETGKAEKIFENEHTKPIYALAFSPNGANILTGSKDGTVKLWNIETGKIEKTFNDNIEKDNMEEEQEEEIDEISSIAFTPEGTQILTGNWNGTAKVWSIEHEDKFSFKLSQSAISSVAFLPDGDSILAGYDDGRLLLKEIDIDSNTVIITAHSDAIYHIAVSPYDKAVAPDDKYVSPVGKYVLTGSEDGTAKLFNIISFNASDKEQYELRLERVFSAALDWGRVNAVAFSPDGKQIATGGDDGTVKVWGVENLRIEEFYRYEEEITSSVFFQNGTKVLTTSREGRVILWEIGTGQGMTLFEYNKPTNAAIVSPNEKYLLVITDDLEIELFTITIENESITFNSIGIISGGLVTSNVFSNNGKNLLIVEDYVKVRSIDLESGQIMNLFEEHSGILSLAFSIDDEKILTGSEDGIVKLWDVKTKQLEKLFENHTDPVNSVAFSPDGRKILTGSEDSSAILWDIETKKVEKKFFHKNSPVYSVAFSPDGKQIATGGRRIATLWDLESGFAMQDFIGHKNDIHSVSFSPDGKNILTYSTDNTAILWRTYDKILENYVHHFDWNDFNNHGLKLTDEDKDKVRIAPSAEKYENKKHLAELFEYYYENNKKYIGVYYNSLLDASFYALLAKEFKQAIAFGDKGLHLRKINSELSEQIETNRAVALLYLGDWGKAKKIYKRLINKPHPYQTTYRIAFIEDLQNMKFENILCDKLDYALEFLESYPEELKTI